MFGIVPFNRRNNQVARRNDPFDMQGIFEDFFNDSFLPAFFTGGNAIRADISETEKDYVVEAEIPGVNKEDIKLDLRDDVLNLTVEHNEQVDEERDNYIRKERRYGSFSRSFYVENVKHDAVTAQYKDGVLRIVLPKSEEGKPKGHSIEIQ